MIGELIGKGAKKANDAVVDDARDTVADLEELLVGRERAELSLEQGKAVFHPGEDLSTPGGDVANVPASPNTGKGGPQKTARPDFGKPIQFIHFGRVHRDVARGFDAEAATDDSALLEPSVVPGRAVFYRAALEREAVLLGGLARTVASALADKEKKEGNLGVLSKVAADLVGGPGGTATSAASVDMKPFLAKIGTAWDAINKSEITYTDVHKAGVTLHEVRTSLTGYLLTQLGKAKSATPEPAGMLSDLPLIGELPLPGMLGQAVGMFRKVSGKLHDVQTALIFGLSVAMLPAIEQASHQISIDMLRGGKSPIYPLWFQSDDPAAAERKKRDKLADIGPKNDPLGGDLATIGKDINKAVRGAVADTNEAINDAAAGPLEIVDFLSKEVKAAPGNRYLNTAFQAATGKSAALGGSEKLGEVAVSAFYSAISDAVPGFMQGFVQDFVGYVFSVCVEFLRSTYRVLNGLSVDESVNTSELVAAGSAHVLTHLVDFLTAKLGLDDLLKKLTIQIPPLPPAARLEGLNWPRDDLSAAPIADELKRMLVDKAAPCLEPVVNYAMSGLAARLNAQREWAAGKALTMEAHLAQLPSELALLFRDLFKPLWELLTDTLMSIVSDVVGKALGPAGEALGVAGDALGVVSGFIADAQKKAKELEAFAKKVEGKADELIKKLSHVSIGPGQTDDLDAIDKAADDLMNAATSDPFSAATGKTKRTKTTAAGSGFPGNRKPFGRGVKILAAELRAVEDVVVAPDAAPANQTATAKVGNS